MAVRTACPESGTTAVSETSTRKEQGLELITRPHTLNSHVHTRARNQAQRRARPTRTKGANGDAYLFQHVHMPVSCRDVPARAYTCNAVVQLDPVTEHKSVVVQLPSFFLPRFACDDITCSQPHRASTRRSEHSHACFPSRIPHVHERASGQCGPDTRYVPLLCCLKEIHVGVRVLWGQHIRAGLEHAQ